mgnify:CR=1 FL=1
MSSGVRAGVLAILLIALVSVQYAALDLIAVHGVVPNLVLLLTVAAGLSMDLPVAVVLGFCGGLLMDLAPPAVHPVGGWALAMVIAALLAGRQRDEAADSPMQGLLTVAACSFVATSIYAFIALVSGTPGLGVGQVLGVVLIAVLWDVALAPWLLPTFTKLLPQLLQPEPIRR